MKANEFIKNHGVAEAKRVLHDARGCVGVKLWGKYEFSTDELRSIVESHDLVEKVISDHNKSFKECQIDIHGLNSFVKKNPKIYPKRLKQAILDVESCQ